MECNICGETAEDVKFRGEDYGTLCDECYQEEYMSVHLDDDEDEEYLEQIKND
jgi:hypothetical protein